MFRIIMAARSLTRPLSAVSRFAIPPDTRCPIRWSNDWIVWLQTGSRRKRVNWLPISECATPPMIRLESLRVCQTGGYDAARAYRYEEHTLYCIGDNHGGSAKWRFRWHCEGYWRPDRRRAGA